MAPEPEQCFLIVHPDDILHVHDMSSLCPDPNMVNAYMYQAAGTNGQPAPPPGQAPPTTSPPYSNYQPTPSQGYQVRLTHTFCPLQLQLNYVKTIITLHDVAILCRTWSLRPRLCLPCPRRPLLTVWVTWATSHTACRTWFRHCQDKTQICPPSSPTCQASSRCTNRSAT